MVWYALNMENSNTRKVVKIVYTNWRKETAEREIIPIEIWFGKTEWHREDQWFLKAHDISKNAERDFALKDVQQWHGYVPKMLE